MSKKHLSLALSALFAFSSHAHAQSVVPITGLPVASTPLSGAELVPCVQGGVTKKCLWGSPLGFPITGTATSLSAAVNGTGSSASSQVFNGTGYGSAGALSALPISVVYRDYSTSHSLLFDVQAVNSSAIVKDTAAGFNPGFEWWDAGHEQTDYDFNGYVNGVYGGMAALQSGCLAAFNNVGNGPACAADIPPAFIPGTTALWNLGLPANQWKRGYFSDTVFEGGNVSSGSVPTNTGSCTISNQVGGPTAGEFQASATCAGAANGYVLSMPAAPHGWACVSIDVSQPGTSSYVSQSGRSSTSATFRANTTLGDLINFQCSGY